MNEGKGLSCLIVGAGIAGLAAARSLQSSGWRVRLLDKARGVGGRMATRRLQGHSFDHGAQFFTARSETFKEMVRAWETEGIVEEWSRGFAEGEQPYIPDGHPRYRGVPAMTAVPKFLAAGLDVHLESRVKSVVPGERGWVLALAGGEQIQAGALMLTAPVPQSLEMLGRGGVQLPEAVHGELESLQYDPCIALMALTSEPGRVPEPGAVRFPDGDVRWVADSYRKGTSGAYGLTVHTSPAFSRRSWEREKAELAPQLLAMAAPWIGGQVLDYSVQKWRYSQPRRAHPDRALHVPGLSPLVFAGDAFGGPRVEGAVLSGLAAAEALVRGNTGWTTSAGP